MSTPLLVPGGPSQWSDDVIRRVIRAWIAGYDMRQDEFAEAIGMPPRTFKRRLAGSGPRQSFSAGEVAAAAAFMSKVSGDKVSIADVFAGKLSVFGSPPGDSRTLQYLPEYLKLLPGGGRISAPARPPLVLLSDAA